MESVVVELVVSVVAADVAVVVVEMSVVDVPTDVLVDVAESSESEKLGLPWDRQPAALSRPSSANDHTLLMRATAPLVPDRESEG